jgi:hypothetical protein
MMKVLTLLLLALLAVMVLSVKVNALVWCNICVLLWRLNDPFNGMGESFDFRRKLIIYCVEFSSNARSSWFVVVVVADQPQPGRN